MPTPEARAIAEEVYNMDSLEDIAEALDRFAAQRGAEATPEPRCRMEQFGDGSCDCPQCRRMRGAPPQTGGGDAPLADEIVTADDGSGFPAQDHLAPQTGGGDAGDRAIQHDEPAETPLRKRIGEIMIDGDLPEWAAEQLDQLAREQEAALQSEREAAAAEMEKVTTHKDEEIERLKAAVAEARRAAIEDCAKHLDKMQTGGNAYTNLYAYMARQLRALASPSAPQGDDLEGDVKQGNAEYFRAALAHAAAEARRAAIDATISIAEEVILYWFGATRAEPIIDDYRNKVRALASPPAPQVPRHTYVGCPHEICRRDDCYSRCMDASPPAPPEDHAPGEVTQRWRRHHPQLPIVAPQEETR